MSDEKVQQRRAAHLAAGHDLTGDPVEQTHPVTGARSTVQYCECGWEFEEPLPSTQVPLERLADDVTDGLAALVGPGLRLVPEALGDADRAHDHRDLGHDSGPRVSRGAPWAGVIDVAVLTHPRLPARGQPVAVDVLAVVGQQVAGVDAPATHDQIVGGGLDDGLAVVANDVHSDQAAHVEESASRQDECQYVCKHCGLLIVTDPDSVYAVGTHAEGHQRGKMRCAADPYGFNAEPVGTECSPICNGSRGLVPDRVFPPGTPGGER